MKFGKRLHRAAASFTSPTYAAHLLDYKALKKLIKKLTIYRSFTSHVTTPTHNPSIANTSPSLSSSSSSPNHSSRSLPSRPLSHTSQAHDDLSKQLAASSLSAPSPSSASSPSTAGFTSGALTSSSASTSVSINIPRRDTSSPDSSLSTPSPSPTRPSSTHPFSPPLGDAGVDSALLAKEFMMALSSELVKINGFYSQVVASLVQQVAALRQSLPRDGDPSSLSDVCEQMSQLRKYIVLNYLGVIKIVRKHDKNAAHPVADRMIPHLYAQPFYNSLQVAQLYMEVDSMSRRGMKNVRRDDFNCPICQELLQIPVVLSCSHRFCWKCLSIASSNTPMEDACPVCHKPQLLDPSNYLIDDCLLQFIRTNFAKKGRSANTLPSPPFKVTDVHSSERETQLVEVRQSSSAPLHRFHSLPSPRSPSPMDLSIGSIHLPLLPHRLPTRPWQIHGGAGDRFLLPWLPFDEEDEDVASEVQHEPVNLGYHRPSYNSYQESETQESESFGNFPSDLGHSSQQQRRPPQQQGDQQTEEFYPMQVDAEESEGLHNHRHATQQPSSIATSPFAVTSFHSAYSASTQSAHSFPLDHLTSGHISYAPHSVFAGPLLPTMPTSRLDATTVWVPMQVSNIPPSLISPDEESHEKAETAHPVTLPHITRSAPSHPSSSSFFPPDSPSAGSPTVSSRGVPGLRTRRVPRFPCQQPGCPEGFNTRFALQRHQRTHTGEKPHRCPQCPKSCADNSTLVRHMRIHTRENPLQCSWPSCSRSFSDWTTVRRHEAQHQLQKDLPLEEQTAMMSEEQERRVLKKMELEGLEKKWDRSQAVTEAAAEKRVEDIATSGPGLPDLPLVSPLSQTVSPNSSFSEDLRQSSPIASAWSNRPARHHVDTQEDLDMVEELLEKGSCEEDLGRSQDLERSPSSLSATDDDAMDDEAIGPVQVISLNELRFLSVDILICGNAETTALLRFHLQPASSPFNQKIADLVHSKGFVCEAEGCQVWIGQYGKSMAAVTIFPGRVLLEKLLLLICPVAVVLFGSHATRLPQPAEVVVSSNIPGGHADDMSACSYEWAAVKTSPFVTSESLPAYGAIRVLHDDGVSDDEVSVQVKQAAIACATPWICLRLVATTSAADDLPTLKLEVLFLQKVLSVSRFDLPVVSPSRVKKAVRLLQLREINRSHFVHKSPRQVLGIGRTADVYLVCLQRDDGVIDAAYKLFRKEVTTVPMSALSTVSTALSSIVSASLSSVIMSEARNARGRLVSDSLGASSVFSQSSSSNTSVAPTFERVREEAARTAHTHDNIVKLLGFCLDKTTFGLLLEYCNGGSLQELLWDRNTLQPVPREQSLSPQQRVLCVYQVLTGLQFIHSEGLLHGDLKSLNILVHRPDPGNSSICFKLADFGPAREIGDTVAHFHFTPRWLAPEGCRCMTKASDVYSAGCVIGEVFTQKPPYHWFTHSEWIHTAPVDRGLPYRQEDLTENDWLWSFIQQCCHQQPDSRPSTEDLLSTWETVTAELSSTALVASISPEVENVDDLYPRISTLSLREITSDDRVVGYKLLETDGRARLCLSLSVDDPVSFNDADLRAKLVTVFHRPADDFVFELTAVSRSLSTEPLSPHSSLDTATVPLDILQKDMTEQEKWRQLRAASDAPVDQLVSFISRSTTAIIQEQGANITGLLPMTVEEASLFFPNEYMAAFPTSSPKRDIVLGFCLRAEGLVFQLPKVFDDFSHRILAMSLQSLNFTLYGFALSMLTAQRASGNVLVDLFFNEDTWMVSSGYTLVDEATKAHFMCTTFHGLLTEHLGDARLNQPGRIQLLSCSYDHRTPSWNLLHMAKELVSQFHPLPDCEAECDVMKPECDAALISDRRYLFNHHHHDSATNTHAPVKFEDCELQVKFMHPKYEPDNLIQANGLKGASVMVFVSATLSLHGTLWKVFDWSLRKSKTVTMQVLQHFIVRLNAGTERAYPGYSGSAVVLTGVIPGLCIGELRGGSDDGMTLMVVPMMAQMKGLSSAGVGTKSLYLCSCARQLYLAKAHLPVDRSEEKEREG